MATLTQDVKQLVQEKAKAIRVSIVQSVTAAKSGHPGGSLSIADVMALVYYVEMNVDPANPKAPNRDRFVLSKGHAAPALYAIVVRQAERAAAALVERLDVGGLHGTQARGARVAHERGQGRRGWLRQVRQSLLDGVQLGLEVIPRVVQEDRDRHAHTARVLRIHLRFRSGRRNTRNADESAHRTTSRGSIWRPSGVEPPIGRFDVAGARPWKASTS